MAIYDHYAEVYDDSGQIAFSIKMIPYLEGMLELHPAPGRSMLDLACGTGTVALSFAQQGWEVYGVDASPAMLDQAKHKAAQTGQELILSRQDMREFVVPHSFALITCLYDSLNYMLSLGDLKQVFRRVAAALLPDGVFMGDMNTRVTLEQVWGNNTFFIEREGIALVMLSSFEAQSGLSTVDIAGFVRRDDGRYSRFDEHHAEVAYHDDEVRAALEAAGLKVEAAYNCFLFEPAEEDARRIMWVARKPRDRR
jgi:predicted TPR repeat methyltransferase